MKYIEVLNAFNDLMLIEPLPQGAQLLYYKLLNIWNKCGRRDWFFATNQRLVFEIMTSSNNTLMRNRDKLIEAGLIDFKPGKKGQPSKYRIKKIQYQIQYHDSTENGTENGMVFGTVFGTLNCTHNRGTDKRNSIAPYTHAREGKAEKQEADTDKLCRILEVYSARISAMPNPSEVQMLRDFAEVYATDDIVSALERTKKRKPDMTGMRALRYAEAILKDWAVNGKDEEVQNASKTKNADMGRIARKNEATSDDFAKINGWEDCADDV